MCHAITKVSDQILMRHITKYRHLRARALDLAKSQRRVELRVFRWQIAHPHTAAHPAASPQLGLRVANDPRNSGPFRAFVIVIGKGARGVGGGGGGGVFVSVVVVAERDEPHGEPVDDRVVRRALR